MTNMTALKYFAQILLFSCWVATAAYAGAGAQTNEELNAAIKNAQEPTVKAADFNTILAAKSDALVVWQFSGNPDIYIFDFPNLTQQGKTFNRVTQLTEQFAEPYKRVLTNQEMDEYLASIRRTQANMAFGNDILVSELTLFYNLAENGKVELNPEELMLRNFAITNGLIKVWRKFYEAILPNAVILSIPQTQEKRENEPRVTDLARRTVLSHELAHGEYYSNPYYAKHCAHFWGGVLDDNQRNVFKKFLSKYNYSSNEDELFINETQAYLMFTPDPSSFSEVKLGISFEELDGMRKAFRKGMPATGLPINF